MGWREGGSQGGGGGMEGGRGYGRYFDLCRGGGTPRKQKLRFKLLLKIRTWRKMTTLKPGVGESVTFVCCPKFCLCCFYFPDSFSIYLFLN